MDEKELQRFRIQKGYLTIKELSDMFGIGRDYIDYGINIGMLKYMSPNNKLRIVKLDDFIKYMEMNPRMN